MVKAAIRRYLASGDYDANDWRWPGDSYAEKETNQHATLTGALIAEVGGGSGAEPAVSTISTS